MSHDAASALLAKLVASGEGVGSGVVNAGGCPEGGAYGVGGDDARFFLDDFCFDAEGW